MSVIETDLEGDFGESAKNDWILGVSEKGEMSFGTCLPERDGILVGLLFAEMTAISGNGLRQIVELVENRSGRGFYKSIDIMGGSPENPNLLSKLRSSISSIYPGEVPVSLQLYEHAGQVRGIKIRWGFCRWLFAELIAGGSAIRIHVEANTNEELRSTLGQATSVLNTLISHHPQL
jgi:phosphomannomutase